MVFISGPKQVGKTTISKNLLSGITNSNYLNWDYLKDRNIILNKHHELFENILMTISDTKSRVVFDEIHKFNGIIVDFFHNVRILLVLCIFT